MNNTGAFICVFPYIEISKPLFIRGEVLFPYEGIDNMRMPEQQREAIKKVQQYFYWYNNQNIVNIAWTYLPPSATNKEVHRFKKRIEEVRRIIGYLCCIPDERPQYYGLSYNYEQADYYLFSLENNIWQGFVNCISLATINEIDLETDKYLTGFSYSVNQGGNWYVVEGCRIYPSSGDIRRPFELENLLDRTAHQVSKLNVHSLFAEHSLDDEQGERIFNALEWYNRSCKAEITLDVSLVYLAIALETLLTKRFDEEQNEKTSKTKTIYDSIQFLIGDTPRLDTWCEQFYNARSRIVHDGEWSQLQFIASNQPNPPKATTAYGYLTHYGWLVFRICVNAKIAGYVRASELAIKSKFFGNHERLEQMKGVLSESKDPYDTLERIVWDIKALFDDPSADEQHIDFATAWKVGYLLAQAVLELDIELDPKHASLLKEIVKDSTPTAFDDQDGIIEHTTALFTDTNELPENEVRKPALEQLNSANPPSILEIKRNITQILEDSRNKDISPRLRQQLKNIVDLVDYNFYRAKLSVFTSPRPRMGGDFISMRRPFTLIDGYTQFVEHLIQGNQLQTRMYLTRVRHWKEQMAIKSNNMDTEKQE